MPEIRTRVFQHEVKFLTSELSRILYFPQPNITSSPHRGKIPNFIWSEPRNVSSFVSNSKYPENYSPRYEQEFWQFFPLSCIIRYLGLVLRRYCVTIVTGKLYFTEISVGIFSVKPCICNRQKIV